jgi:glycerol-3-phosphate dehydrogenase (NAD(P)+)
MRRDEILVVGSGSWATALVKILADAGAASTIHWYVRKKETAENIACNAENKPYGKGFYIPLKKVKLYHRDLPPPPCALVLHAVPSAYSLTWYEEFNAQALTPEVIISAAKGIVPQSRQTTSEWLKIVFNNDSIVYLGGPCHSEEVLREARSYLTMGAHQEDLAHTLAKLFTTPYLTVSCVPHPEAIELFGILKNIMAIAVGVALGLGYGDNFTAILVAAAFREMITMAIQRGQLPEPSLAAHGGFLGDLLVTCFSPHSRNRRFGSLVAQGHTPEEALSIMKMVPEGYYVIQAWGTMLDNSRFPISQTLVHILLQNKNAADSFKQLEKLLNT